ncbi:DUF2004 domain-containing protein [Cellulophaga sp. BC115SP]|uniref:DUF2004 domain-containing protein n=1 Tax=Cellulophaga sp. BC115SP TaxID=2683263 RepID=UPI0014134C4B|nr:DUF2004 domain-containing protein [Cellulophaga sp. BC115SP]NBB28100.1 DUF2004 domain-containing protein [Cellulophaga sp. BC115SP]
MKTFDLTYFGVINITQLEKDYRTKTIYSNKALNLDINFENESIDEEQALEINHILNNISAIDEENRKQINKDFKKKGETRDYITFYLEELFEEELQEIIDYNDKSISKEKQLLNKLILIRVGLYPDNASIGYSVVFDYSIEIEGEPCNQLLVVKTDIKGKLDHITWES